MRTRSLVLLALAICLCAPSALARRRAVRHPSPPEPGPCAVRGLANLYYSTDGGATWSRNAEAPARTGMRGLAAIPGDPERLLAYVGPDLWESSDAGCNWALRATIAQAVHHTPHIEPASNGRAFIWTEDWAVRYDDGVVTTLPLPETIGVLGVNPGNREHVRVLDLDDGRARESLDGGMTWRDVGGFAGGRVNSGAFDPSDFEHIVAGVQTRGIVISRNGGRTWTAGASASVVCWIAFVKSSPNVVWATVPTGPGGGAFVRRSTDGGSRLEDVGGFGPVESNLCFAILPNPHDANEAVIPFRDFFYELNAAQKSVTPWSCCGGQMHRIAWAPNDPARVYVFTPPK